MCIAIVEENRYYRYVVWYVKRQFTLDDNLSDLNRSEYFTIQTKENIIAYFNDACSEMSRPTTAGQ